MKGCYFIIKKYFRKLLFLFIASTLAGCDVPLLDPKNSLAKEQKTLFITSTALMLVIVIPTIILVFLFVFKYRSSNKTSKITYDPNLSGSKKIEFLVWSAPIIVITFLAIITWKTTNTLDPYRKINYKLQPIEIDVIALNWKWLFLYPKQRIASVNELVFPSHTPIRFIITSYSVMNSFFIPGLGSQIYAMPNMKTELNISPSIVGAYTGISSNYSGTGFSDMKFNVKVLQNVKSFNQWITKVEKSVNMLRTFDEFKKFFMYNKCDTCKYFSNVNPDIFEFIAHRYHHK